MIIYHHNAFASLDRLFFMNSKRRHVSTTRAASFQLLVLFVFLNSGLLGSGSNCSQKQMKKLSWVGFIDYCAELQSQRCAFVLMENFGFSAFTCLQYVKGVKGQHWCRYNSNLPFSPCCSINFRIFRHCLGFAVAVSVLFTALFSSSVYSFHLSGHLKARNCVIVSVI